MPVLEQTSLPLKDIAGRAHIGDASTLWRIFTRYTGAIPSAFHGVTTLHFFQKR